MPDLSFEADTFKNLLAFGAAVKSGLSTKGGADSSGRNSHYRKATGEIAGCINVALWHAIGHEVSRQMSQMGFPPNSYTPPSFPMPYSPRDS